MAKLTQMSVKVTKFVNVLIIDYPNSSQSAVHGLNELLLMANTIVSEHQLDVRFSINIAQPTDVLRTLDPVDIVILPPSLGGDYYRSPQPLLSSFLIDAHRAGAILCSACAGAFLLANTGLLNNRQATTHWQLADTFVEKFPDISLKIDSLLINDGDLICVGGLMSWIDLGLEMVMQFTSLHIMRALGKYLIIDTGKREQRYYSSFKPKFSHGNQQIIYVQQHIQTHYNQPLCITSLAALIHMSERTFLRHFTNATMLKPVQYIQRVRVQKACDLLESTTQSFEEIALSVGYGDANSFRKVFIKVIGLSPTEFKARFV